MRGLQQMAAVWRAAAIILLLLSACTRTEAPRPSPVPRDTVRCEVDNAPPKSFHLANEVMVEVAGHVGLRMTYADAGGRRLHFASGIAGEFGEGLRESGTFFVVTGEEATLLGSEAGWVFVWSESGPCAQKTVTGNGFTRSEFLRVLEQSGVIALGH